MVDQTTIERGNGRPPPGGVTRNVADLAHDLVTLAELQGQLLAADLRDGAEQAKTPAVLLVVTPVLALSALPVLLLGCARLLANGAGWSESASLLTVGAIALALAALLGWLGWARLQKALSVVTRSREEFTENVRWLKATLSRGSKV